MGVFLLQHGFLLRYGSLFDGSRSLFMRMGLSHRHERERERERETTSDEEKVK